MKELKHLLIQSLNNNIVLLIPKLYWWQLEKIWNIFGFSDLGIIFGHTYFTSEISMFPQESCNILLMHIILLILLPPNSRLEKHLISPARTCNLFLDLLIIVNQSRNFTSFPREMTKEEAILDRYKEEQSIDDDRPLIDISPHSWVWCLYHIYFFI